MNKQEDLFLKNMKGVKPINKKNTIKKEITTPQNNPPASIGRLKPKTIIQKTTPELTTKNLKLENDPIIKNLKRGRVKIDRKIDFHGNSLFDAENIFKKTIIECYNNNKRCLLFVTGKGTLSAGKNNFQEEQNNSPKLFYGKIRRTFKSWVEKKEFNKYILTFCKATHEHGGDGAFYVYLRKNKN